MKINLDINTEDIWVDADSTLKALFKDVFEDEIRRAVRKEAKALLEKEHATIQKRAREILNDSLKAVSVDS